MKITKIQKEKQGTIIDVRTPVEFMQGNAPGSINIPLQDLRNRLAEIKNLKQPVILCCASGARSAQATKLISEQGVECVNAGSWINLNYSEPKNV